METHVFTWKPYGVDPEEDKFEDMLRRSFYNLEKIPEASRSVRTWLFAFLMGYSTGCGDSQRFLTQKQITSEMRFLIYGHNAKQFKKEIENDANAFREYPWLVTLLNAMHTLGEGNMHQRRGIDVNDNGTRSYAADVVGRDQIKSEQRWLSTIPPNDRTLALCTKYVMENFLNISDVPLSILTEELCIGALIVSRAQVWPRIPKPLRTSKVRLVAFGMASDFKNAIPKAVKDEYPWAFELITQMHLTSSNTEKYEINSARQKEEFRLNRICEFAAEESRVSAIHERNQDLW